MPDHLVHTYLDRLYFGKAYWKVHRLMDCAWLVCRRGHRRYYHDWISSQIIASSEYPMDENAVLSAWLHIQTDAACSADPLLKEQLEVFAKAEVRKRKRPKKREQPSPEITKFLEDLEKLAEVQRLARLLRS